MLRLLIHSKSWCRPARVILCFACLVAISQMLHLTSMIQSDRTVFHKVHAIPLVSAENATVVVIMHSRSAESTHHARQLWFQSSRKYMAFLDFGSFPEAAIRKRSDNPYENSRAALLQAAALYPTAQYIAKFDDDTYVYTKNLVYALTQLLKPGEHYWGYPLTSEWCTFASGGAGYVLDRYAISLLDTPKCKPPNPHPYEDVGVGLCMLQHKVSVVHLDGLHPHNPPMMLQWDLEGHSADHVVRRESQDSYFHPLSYHYMDPESMRRMHDSYHNFGNDQHSPFPRILHQYWESDHRLPPAGSIESCREMHPAQRGWEYRLWSSNAINQRMPNRALINQKSYDRADLPLYGKSDVARYEMLLLYGGVYLDADSRCLQPIDTLMDELDRAPEQGYEGFCTYEDEDRRANVEGHMLITNGAMGLRAYSPVAMMLVRELSAVDWNLPVWKAVGPLYLTKILARVQQSHPEYVVRRLSSHVFYPYHFEDVKPVSLPEYRESLAAVNALTDQFWASTKNLYREGHQRELYDTRVLYDPNIVPKESAALKDVLLRYTQVHARGLELVHAARPRWIVARLDDNAGLCNRVTHLISALLFGILTDRVLLFDWKAVPAQIRDPRQAESIGNAAFEAIFHDPPIAFRHEAAKSHLGISEDGYSRWANEEYFTNTLATKNLDMAFPYSVLSIDRYDWWAPMLFQNPHYRHLFRNLTPTQVFRALFFYLFRPRAIQDDVSPNCDWLIHIRRSWERPTAPISAFTDCAILQGLRSTDHVYLMHDSDADLKAYNPAISKSVRSLGPACRNGNVDCDQRSLSAMLLAATCKRAVLTHTSTFGACSTAIGMIVPSYVVKANGECTERPFTDPVGAGLMDNGPHLVEQAISLAVQQPAYQRFAFLYVVMHPSMEQVGHLRQSLRALHKHFNHLHPYPIVLVVDDESRWTFLQAENSARLHFLEIKSPHHPVSGLVFTHPRLVEQFDFVIKLEIDTLARGEWALDPFQRISDGQTQFGFWRSYHDLNDTSQDLYDIFLAFVKQEKLKLSQPFLLLDGSSQYRHTRIDSCFVGYQPSFFHEPLYHRLLDFFDQHRVVAYEWEEQVRTAFYVALVLDDSQVEYFNYADVECRGVHTPQRM